MGCHPRPRLLIADDCRWVAEACKSLLQPEFDVVGIVNNGGTLLQSALELKPDAVLLDVNMPVAGGLDAGEQLRQRLPEVKIVYWTVDTDAALAAEALRRGASGYIYKNAAASELPAALREVLAGRCYVSALIGDPRW